MLSQLVKQHQDKQLNSRRKSDTDFGGWNQPWSGDAYKNQRKLDQESKKLLSCSAKYMKQTSQWLSLVEGLHNTLKGLGDLEQWAKLKLLKLIWQPSQKP